MAIRVEDVLSVNVVLVGLELLKTAPEVAAFSAAIGREFLQDGGFIDAGPQMAPVPGRVVRSPRERILVELSAHRSRVTKEYPTSIDDVALVARVTAQAIASTTIQEPEVPSHGFNFAMVYSPDPDEDALRYLGRRIFAPPTFSHEEWTAIGGFGRLKFQDGSRQWTITLEPRLQALNTSKVFLEVNLHVPEAGVPEEDQMETQLRMLWQRAHTLIEAIDANVND